MPNVIETTDAAAGTSTTYNLAVGQTARGTLSPAGDSDWYRVTLVAGHTYTFAEVGTGNASVNLDDAYIRLMDSSGNLITGDDDGGPGYNSTVTFTASSTGTYYINAGSYSSAYAGQYGISVTEGTRASYDEEMGAGILLRQNASWSTPELPPR